MAVIENFKGKIHKLSSEDKLKGGKVSSPKKTLANRINNLKHGKYSKYLHPILHCSECPYSHKCSKFKEGYCVYLLEDLKKDKVLRNNLLKKCISKDSNDLIPFVVAKYSLQKEFIKYLKNKFR